LREDRRKEVDRIAAANLMPSYLTREQYKADSIRAYEWFKMTKDSSYIDKYTYQKTEIPFIPFGKSRSPSKKKSGVQYMVIVDDKNLRKKNYSVPS
jgi:penicillin-binding protein 2